MELSKRLKKITSMVDNCHTIIDVGTDHGYIPIHLIKNKFCEHVIASDINIGPVNKAKINIKLENLEEEIECRHGSGLKVIKPGEAQGAVIAGMGGNLIRDIIEASVDVVKSLSYIILQPVQNPEILRKYLYEAGYDIIDEEICEEENKFYEIIKVKYGDKPVFLDEMLYEISPILTRKNCKCFREYINAKLYKYTKILNNINEDTEAAIERRVEISNKIIRIKEMLS